MKNKFFLSSSVWAITAGGQVIAAWLLYDPSMSSTRVNLGWLIIFVSGIFGWLPIFTFRLRGEVKGQSYIHTTVLVDSGIFSIVRHPQYLAGLLINFALPLISFHWLVILLGVFSVGMYHWSAIIEEESNLEKFGEAYKDYMCRVPRFNIILGLLKIIQKSHQTDHVHVD